MWVFVTPKDNPNVGLLLGFPWLRSVDAKLLIQKKEIHIGDVKEGETVFQIPCSTTTSEDTQFDAKKRGKADTEISSDEEDTGVVMLPLN